MDKYKDQAKKPVPADAKKTRIEREENEDLEVDEGLPQSGTSKAEEGLAETPENTGGEPTVVRRKSANDVSNPDAVVEEMRNQDA
ncbi:MAG TPA: hypothetical protein VM144_10510 [Aestuariivirga sp.]|nr:hypothetical protein [Aestuariivirga sp.]